MILKFLCKIVKFFKYRGVCLLVEGIEVGVLKLNGGIVKKSVIGEVNKIK